MCRELTHDIGLCADGDETVDVLADWDKDLAGHMAALLGTWSLVLNVDTSSTLLDEELRELHDGGQATMASISIGDDRAEVVHAGDSTTLILGGREALLALLAVVEKLGHPQLVDLVWDSGLKKDESRCDFLGGQL